MRILGWCLILLSALPVQAQRPAFEAASIRRNNSGLANGGAGPRGDRFVANNVSLLGLLLYANIPAQGQFLKSQILGGPDWADSERYDIEAKMSGDMAALGITQIRAMLQTLLEDRFQLKSHREMRELPVYNLVLVKNGPKLSADQTPPETKSKFIFFASPGEEARTLPRGAMRLIRSPAETTIEGTALEVSQLVALLQGQSDRIVMDRTNFHGLFDARLTYTTAVDAAPGANSSAAPSLFTAVQDLGLKLESAKAPLEVVVIESVRRPSEN